MQSPWIFLGAINAGLAVALGAFGAHGLKGQLEPGLFVVYQTAAEYHLTHALGLILVGALQPRLESPWLRASGWGLMAGIVLFCGSLYALAISGHRALGAITPLGGTAFLIAWAALAIAAWRQDRP